MNVLEKQNLEKILLANWASFLDVRKLMTFVKTKNNLGLDTIFKLSVSRFEPTEKGFLIWLETESNILENKVKVTTEALLTLSGEILHISSEII